MVCGSIKALNGQQTAAVHYSQIGSINKILHIGMCQVTDQTVIQIADYAQSSSSSHLQFILIRQDSHSPQLLDPIRVHPHHRIANYP